MAIGQVIGVITIRIIIDKVIQDQITDKMPQWTFRNRNQSRNRNDDHT